MLAASDQAEGVCDQVYRRGRGKTGYYRGCEDFRIIATSVAGVYCDL